MLSALVRFKGEPKMKTVFMSLVLLLTLPLVVSAEPHQSNRKAMEQMAGLFDEQRPAALPHRPAFVAQERIGDLPPRAIIDSHRDHVRYRRHVQREMALRSIRAEEDPAGLPFLRTSRPERLNDPGHRPRSDMRGGDAGQPPSFGGVRESERGTEQRGASAHRGIGPEMPSRGGQPSVEMSDRQERGQRTSSGPRQ